MNAIKFKKRTLFVNTQTTIQKKTHTHFHLYLTVTRRTKKEKDHRIKSEEETCRFT